MYTLEKREHDPTKLCRNRTTPVGAFVYLTLETPAWHFLAWGKCTISPSILIPIGLAGCYNCLGRGRVARVQRVLNKQAWPVKWHAKIYIPPTAHSTMVVVIRFTSVNTGARVIQFRLSRLASAACDAHFVALALRRAKILPARSRVSSATLADDRTTRQPRRMDDASTKALLYCLSSLMSALITSLGSQSHTFFSSEKRCAHPRSPH